MGGDWSRPREADVISISGDFGCFLRVAVVQRGEEEVKHSNMI